MGKSGFSLKSVWLQTMLSNMGWKVWCKGERCPVCDRKLRKNTLIFWGKGSTSPIPILSQTEVCSHLVASWFVIVHSTKRPQRDSEPSGLGDSYLCNEDITGRRCRFLFPGRQDWSPSHQAIITCKSSPAWPAHLAIYLCTQAHSHR